MPSNRRGCPPWRDLGEVYPPWRLRSRPGQAECGWLCLAQALTGGARRRVRRELADELPIQGVRLAGKLRSGGVRDGVLREDNVLRTRADKHGARQGVGIGLDPSTAAQSVSSCLHSVIRHGRHARSSAEGGRAHRALARLQGRAHLFSLRHAEGLCLIESLSCEGRRHDRDRGNVPRPLEGMHVVPARWRRARGTLARLGLDGEADGVRRVRRR